MNTATYPEAPGLIKAQASFDTGRSSNEVKTDTGTPEEKRSSEAQIIRDRSTLSSQG